MDDKSSNSRVIDWARTRCAAIDQEIERLQIEYRRCQTILEKFTNPYTRACTRCKKIVHTSQPITADVFYCSNNCAD